MKKWTFLLAGLACLIGAQPAQGQISLGPQLGWSNDWDLGLGARVELGLANTLGIQNGPFANLYGTASGTYFWWRSFWSLIELNPNVAVPFEIGRSLTPFVGTGLQLTRFRIRSDVETDVGLNILGGVKYPVFGLTSFAEAKVVLGGNRDFTISGGVLFGGR